MASNTDLLKKLSRRWVGQVGAAGVSDGTTTTVPLASVTNLATDTAVVVVIDRVDANGVATPSLEETIIGVVSGSNLINCVRAAEGTAQAHNAGAVVEVLVTAKGWNDLIDGLLVQHTQLGYHTNITACNITASGTSILSHVTACDITATSLSVSGLVLQSTTKYSPQGFLINGKIVPSVASNNLTVAIKGMDGNDPSATNPVYVRIGDTVRTITAALSVTKNAGTNWFNSGGAELATKEIDYFVYLGYNATDGVVIGFSRIIGKQYSDFSSTTTNEKYAGISTITNAAAGDYYEVIGRFAATLSAGAGYTWTVPTFTALNLIQRPIFNTRQLDFVPVFNGTTGSVGTAAATVSFAKYIVKDNGSIDISYYFKVTNKGSWTGTFEISLPFICGINNQGLAGTIAATSTNPITASKGFPYTIVSTNKLRFLSSVEAAELGLAAVAVNDVAIVAGTILI